MYYGFYLFHALLGQYVLLVLLVSCATRTVCITGFTCFMRYSDSMYYGFYLFHALLGQYVLRVLLVSCATQTVCITGFTCFMRYSDSMYYGFYLFHSLLGQYVLRVLLVSCATRTVCTYIIANCCVCIHSYCFLLGNRIHSLFTTIMSQVVNEVNTARRCEFFNVGMN